MGRDPIIFGEPDPSYESNSPKDTNALAWWIAGLTTSSNLGSNMQSESEKQGEPRNQVPEEGSESEEG
jgi:hypothetical protein